MTKIPSVEERVESLQVTSKLETNEQYLERVQKIMQQDRLALLQALYDELEGKKKIQNDALDLAKPYMGGVKCVIIGRIEAIQDQQDNLQALMDSIRVWQQQ